MRSLSTRLGGTWSRRPPSGRLLTTALVGAVLVALYLLVVLTGLAGTATLRTATANAISGPLAALATVALARNAVRTRTRTRLAWGLLATGVGCWAVAETIWWVRRALSDAVALVGLDDVFFLVGTPFVVAGAASFPVASWRRADRLRAVLDGFVVGGALLFAVAASGLFRPDPGRWQEQLVALAYPTSDVAVLFVAVAVVLRAPRRAALPLGLVVGALAVYALGDLGYGVEVARGTYVSGTPLDLTWNYAYLLLGLAALIRPAEPGPDVVGGTVDRGRVLPWVLVGSALVGIATVVLTRPAVLEDRAVAAVVAAVALVFLGRQTWLVADLSRLNARLGRHSARVEQMADAVVDAILVVDRRGCVAYANDPAAVLLGYPRAALVLRPLAGLVHHDDPGSARLLDALGSTTSVVQAAATLRRADASPVPVDVSVGPIDHRSPTGMIMVFRDASAQRALERMKDEFTSVISHEVRTPLTSIRGALTLLDGGVTGELAPAAARMVRIAVESTDRLSRLINDILDADRLESGHVRLDVAPEPAASLVERAAFEMGGQAASAGVEVVTDASAGTVLADADRVVQVLANLVGNAIKFSPAGAQVRVGATPVDGMVELWVADHGRGIPAAKQAVIFDRYQQVDASDARQQGGTGLGLAICRDIVALHGGRIWVTSEQGVGSEFRFSLPAGEPVPAAPIADAQDGTHRHGQACPVAAP